MIIQGYSLDFFRNIKDFKYVPRLTIEEKNKVRDMILNAISKENLPLNFLPSYKMDKAKIDYIQEENLLAMTYSDSSDPAVLFDDNGKIMITINDMDHFLFSLKSDGDVIETYRYGNKIMDNLSMLLDFQKDRTLGYLSSSIPLCGNGFVVDVLVHIPALMSQNKVIFSVNKALRKIGALIIPFNHTVVPNSFFIIRCISKTEPESDIKFVVNLAEELEVMEAAKVDELRDNEDFIFYLQERVEQNKAKGTVSFDYYLRYLDDCVLYEKIKGNDIKPSFIKDALVATQPQHMLQSGVSNEDVERYYYDIIFNDRGGRL